MDTTTCLSLAILLCGVARADDWADRGKLMGSWQIEQGSEGVAQWSFTVQGDSMKVTETESGNTIADFVCNTEGKPCEVRISGKKVSVSLWYNGPKLVELEQHGSESVERRFRAPSDDQMEVEVVQVGTGGKETLRFKRAVAK